MLTTEIVTILAAGVIGCLLSGLATPVVRWLAPSLGLVDSPDPNRKLHQGATPVGGGLAVFFATVAAVVLIPFVIDSQSEILARGGELLGILLACCIIVAVGVMDDVFGMRGKQKLAGQICAALTLCCFGLIINNVRIFNWEIELGLLAIPFTVAWFLGAINAINLLDGADGMASTVGIVICGAISILAYLGGYSYDAMMAAALAGALLGFLLYNFPPASIFLGDCGSMLIGLAIGILAVRASLKGPATLALSTPLALMAIPIFDCGAAVVRRWLTGRSVYATDRGHLHHCLLRRGVGPRGLLIWVALLCVGTAGGALVSAYLRNEQAALISTVLVLILLVVTRIFGYGEFLLVWRRALSLVNSIIGSSRPELGAVRQHSTVLQGSRDWEQVWISVTAFAELHQLCQVRLVLNLAWLHEAYHAEWERSHASNSSDQWFVRIPLVASDRTVGKLEFSGPASDTTRADCEMLGLLAELVDSQIPSIERISVEHPREGSPAFDAPSPIVRSKPAETISS